MARIHSKIQRITGGDEMDDDIIEIFTAIVVLIAALMCYYMYIKGNNDY